MYKYILIDLDGTLTDPKLGIHTCIRYALNQLGQPLENTVDLDWTIGPPLKDSFLKLLCAENSHLADEALVKYRERFASIGLFENQLYDDVKETLEYLVASGYILYVATAKPTIYAMQILKHFEINHYFKAVYGSELSGERTNKADLIAYLLEKERIDAQSCIMVGDREYDILGARHNHIKTIAVQYGYGTKSEFSRAKPAYQIASFSELMAFFKFKFTH